MSDFAGDLNRFVLNLRAKERAVFVNTASAVKGSIVDGSPLTGAPGQPVDTGTLKASWQLTFSGPSTAEVSTNTEYAPIIEYNVRGAHLRSTVGGFHSVAMTVAGFERLVEAETRKVNP